MARDEIIRAEGAAIDPVVIDRVVSIPLGLIDATDRLREVSEAHAQVLAANFHERGQRTPVEVVRRGGQYRLVYGAHRFRAAQIAGLGVIKAVITEMGEAEARLAEIDENLIRHELTALDRARFLAERKRLYEALNPAAKHGGDRKSDQVANLATWSFSADIADKTGFSERTIRRSVLLAEKLSPEAVQRLTGTAWADHQAALETLAKHPPDVQAAVLDHLLAAENPAKSVNEALARHEGRAAPTVEDKTLSRAIDLWGRMGAKDKRAFLEFLAEAELPKGWTVGAPK